MTTPDAFDVRVTPASFTFQKQRQSVIQRTLTRVALAAAAYDIDSDEEEISDTTSDDDDLLGKNLSISSAFTSIGNPSPAGSIKLKSRISILANEKISEGKCVIESNCVTCKTADEALKHLEKIREKQEGMKERSKASNKRRRRRTDGPLTKSMNHLFRKRFVSSASARRLPTSTLYGKSRSNLPRTRTTPALDHHADSMPLPLQSQTERTDTDRSDKGVSWLVGKPQSLKPHINEDDSLNYLESIASPSMNDLQSDIGGADWADANLPSIQDNDTSSALKLDLAKSNSYLAPPGADEPIEEDSVEEVDDGLPFDSPLQPEHCPRNPVGQEVMYLYEDDDTWYPFKIVHYNPRRDEADGRCLELFEGEEWGDEFKLKQKFDDEHLFFLNPELAEKEAQSEHFDRVFSLIDEKSNGDLSFSDFAIGIRIYEKAEDPLNLTRDNLKEVFCAIHGECDLEDLEEDEDEFNIDSYNFLQFCFQRRSENQILHRFLNVMWQPNLPQRKMILCKTTDKFYPESQIIHCEDSGDATWKRAARIPVEFPDKAYCPQYYQRHLCGNCGKFELEPHYLEEGTDYEEVFCHKCFSTKFAHDVKLTFDTFPLPFKLRLNSTRPYIKDPSKGLVLQDVVEGSVIREIDGKRVGHRAPEDIKIILSMIAPPIEISFRVFVPRYHQLQKLKTFSQLMQIACWDIDMIDEVKGDAVRIDGDEDEGLVHENYIHENDKKRPKLQKNESELDLDRFTTIEDGDIRDDDEIFENDNQSRGHSVSEYLSERDLEEISSPPLYEMSEASSHRQKLSETPRGKARSVQYNSAPEPDFGGAAMHTSKDGAPRNKRMISTSSVRSYSRETFDDSSSPERKREKAISPIGSYPTDRSNYEVDSIVLGCFGHVLNNMEMGVWNDSAMLVSGENCCFAFLNSIRAFLTSIFITTPLSFFVIIFGITKESMLDQTMKDTQSCCPTKEIYFIAFGFLVLLLVLPLTGAFLGATSHQSFIAILTFMFIFIILFQFCGWYNRYLHKRSGQRQPPNAINSTPFVICIIMHSIQLLFYSFHLELATESSVDTLMSVADLALFIDVKDSKGFHANFFLGMTFASLTFLLYNLEVLFELRQVGRLRLQSESRAADNLYQCGLVGSIIFGNQQVDLFHSSIRVWFQIFSHFLYILTLDKLLLTVACEKNGDMHTLVIDPDVECWKGTHRTYGIFTLLIIGFYVLFSGLISPLICGPYYLSDFQSLLIAVETLLMFVTTIFSMGDIVVSGALQAALFFACAAYLVYTNGFEYKSAFMTSGAWGGLIAIVDGLVDFEPWIPFICLIIGALLIFGVAYYKQGLKLRDKVEDLNNYVYTEPLGSFAEYNLPRPSEDASGVSTKLPLESSLTKTGLAQTPKLKKRVTFSDTEGVSIISYMKDSGIMFIE